MSIHANVMPGLFRSEANAAAPPQARIWAPTHGWNPENFAREQIRGMVRRVFFNNAGQSAKQVVFSAAETATNVGTICDQVGHALAVETPAAIAIVARNFQAQSPQVQTCSGYSKGGELKSLATQIAPNLWRVPEAGLRELYPESSSGRFWLWALARLRTDFEYVVIQGPAAGESSESALLGQLTDGIILVLEAHSTRKATARKLKEMLEGTRSRILGTVLSQRTFPVPEMIYRRL
jgi:hypothetical protein